MVSTKAGSRARSATVAGALLVASVAPLATMAVPAEASTYRAGCTVTPLRPAYSHHNSDGNKVILYRVRVTCDANRTAVVNWQGVEEDWSSWYNKDSDDGNFSTTRTVSFGSAGTVTLTRTQTLPNTEDGSEEMYHKVRFVVKSNGVASARTNWERTPYVSFSN